MTETRFRQPSPLLQLAAAASLVALLGACSHHKPFNRSSLVAPSSTETIGVNAYLWRATLQTLNFMPLADANAKGGVVITDWYNNPKAPGERAKVTVYIVSKQLSADGLKVTVFRQKLENGVWVDVADTTGAAAKIEAAILTEARYVHLNTVRAK